MIKQIEYTENNKNNLWLKLISKNNIDSEYINDESYYPIGSITKIFTIYIILILQQKKKLNINDKINIYIKMDNLKFNKITILDLINHTSGIKNFPDKYDYHINDLTVTALTKIIITEDLFKHSYGEYNYSNIGYLLLGYIIEKITKMNYIDVYNKYIFKPLKMSCYVGKPNIKIYNSKYDEIKNLFYILIATTAGAYCANIKDLIKFSKNSIKLLNNKSRNILKKLYIYKKNTISHTGNVLGGNTRLEIKYQNWKPIHIYIKLSTCHL